MDSTAQDSIDALQALLNFKRSAQLSRTQDVEPEVSRTRSVPSSMTESESAYKPRIQGRPNNPLVQSIQNNVMTVAKLEETAKPGVNPNSGNNITVIKKMQFHSGMTNPGKQSNMTTQPETSVGFNPYLFGQQSENFQIYPLSLPMNTVNPLHLETPNPLSSRPQVPQIPSTFSIPATYITPKETIKKEPAQSLTMYAKDTSLGKQTRPLSTSTSHLTSVTGDKSSNEQIQREQSPIIRSEEVEAALRSKPQRGKKRNNLSVLERLELTRTRNREHAKCTRARKKMRMEELESNEKKCFELMRLKDLATARRECVHKFMTLRTAQLSRNRKVSTGGESAWQFSLDPLGNESENNAGQTSQKFQQGLSERKALNPPMTDTNEANVESGKEIFDGVVKHFDSFQFVFQHGTTFSSQGLHLFLSHEKQILDCMKRSHGNSENCSIAYEIVGGTQDIALGANNNGFAFVDLILTVSEEQKYVYNGFIEFRFLSDSHELLFFKHHEFLAKPIHESDSGTSSPLSQQVTFPSVVSLDMHTQGHVLPRLEVHTHDAGARPDIPQDDRIQSSHLENSQTEALSRMNYQHVDTSGNVGMDI